MSTIPGNSKVVVIVGDAQSAFAQSPSDVMNAVSAYLNALAGYSVQSTSFSGGILASISPLMSEQFQATINMTNLYTQDSSQIYADVQNAFEEASNSAYTPNQISIPNYTPLPGSSSGVGTPVDTGQAAPTPTATQSVTDTISNFFKGLTTLGTNLLIGLVAIVVLVLILIAYGPNVGKIASAV